MTRKVLVDGMVVSCMKDADAWGRVSGARRNGQASRLMADDESRLLTADWDELRLDEQCNALDMARTAAIDASGGWTPAANAMDADDPRRVAWETMRKEEERLAADAG